jgi:hypothetical protein
MKYRIRSNGAIATQNEVQRMFSNTSLPAVWNEAVCETLGIDPIFEGPQATGGTVYQYSQEDGVEQIDGNWYTKYILGPVFTDTTVDGVTTTAAENEAAYKAMKDAEQATSIRATRNKKLNDTDWTQVADAPVDQAVWATYRQALRDISGQEGFPWTITWPTQPE